MIFFRAGLSWCKATILATTRDPGHLPSQPLIKKKNDQLPLSKFWQVVSSCVQVIKLMSISHGDRSVDLPSLNVEHNYPHLLSELVMKL